MQEQNRKLYHKRELAVLKCKNRTAFYKFINSKLNSPKNLPALSNDKDDIFVDDIDKANAVNNHFFLHIYCG